MRNKSDKLQKNRKVEEILNELKVNEFRFELAMDPIDVEEELVSDLEIKSASDLSSVVERFQHVVSKVRLQLYMRHRDLRDKQMQAIFEHGLVDKFIEEETKQFSRSKLAESRYKSVLQPLCQVSDKKTVAQLVENVETMEKLMTEIRGLSEKVNKRTRQINKCQKIYKKQTVPKKCKKTPCG